jgi:hypothetical protein
VFKEQQEKKQQEPTKDPPVVSLDPKIRLGMVRSTSMDSLVNVNSSMGRALFPEEQAMAQPSPRPSAPKKHA